MHACRSTLEDPTTAPLTAITAAVVGVIASLALFFGTHVLWPQGFAPGQAPDGAALAIAAGALVALVRFEANIIRLVAVCAALGLAWKLLPGVF